MEYFKNKIFSGWFQLQLNDSIFKEVTNSRIKWKFLLPLASKETWNRKKNVNGIKNCSLSVLGGGAELRGCWCCPGTEGVVDLKESYFSYNPLHHSPHRVTDLPFPPTLHCQARFCVHWRQIIQLFIMLFLIFKDKNK